METSKLVRITHDALGKEYSTSKLSQPPEIRIWKTRSGEEIAIVSQLKKRAGFDVFIDVLYRLSQADHDTIVKVARQYQHYGLRVAGFRAGSYGAH